ncbi:MAG TPA: Re/Si-specific NAD(P)(+) transhydrogenase subunit alpha [Alphaproteobacteria bacterium]|nr:Re/Si-specific NAD(P)(+) transhydrogenase subunit alpha [Alphaproteobacteria bacterium]
MKVAIPKEIRENETRVAASPAMVKKLVELGLEVVVQSGAGLAASTPDEAFVEAGADIATDAAATYDGADLVLKVARPMTADEGTDEMALLPSGTTLVGLLAPLQHRDQVAAYAAGDVTAFAMELIPRISRAQSMDALSSQSNLAGYKAVLDAANEFGRIFPMMMTAAGTVVPAKVLVLGAGVAGLQAIATAKRLGAVVSAFDVRPAVKEQVESLGGKFIEVAAEDAESAESAGGYATEMSEAYQRRQGELIHETLKSQDIAICTALIPGSAAPTLITEQMVGGMKPGSVIVDLATETGGNCELSEHGKVVVKKDVSIVGHANVPGRVPVDASALYARNLLNFLSPMIDAESKSLAIDWEDEVNTGACLTRDGKVLHPLLTGGVN